MHSKNTSRFRQAGGIMFAAILTFALTWTAVAQESQQQPPFHYLKAKAWHVLPETTTDESGYFSLNEGKDGKMYVGTTAYGRNAYLVEFDPETQAQRVVVDAHKAIGLPLTPTGYAAQAKFHTRNFVGPSGKIYLGTKQGYPTEADKRDNIEYPGGYVLIYDPETGETTNLGMPYPTEGVADVVADEARGLLYIATCEDYHWVIYDMEKAEYRVLGPRLYAYATTLMDKQGRAYTVTRDYRIARYDPATDEVTLHDLLVDGEKINLPERPGSGWIPAWNLAEDGETAYLVRLGRPELWRITLGASDDGAIHANDLGPLLGGRGHDTRSALSIGPDGKVYVVMRVNNDTGFGGGFLHHMIVHDPKTETNTDLGVLIVENPDFYGRPLTAGYAVDDEGNRIPWTHGYHALPDGALTPLHSHQALIMASDGSAYITILYPFSLLRVDPRTIQTAGLDMLSD